MSLFFYTRKQDEKVYTDSFNLNKVIRSVQMDDDKLLILLDDAHERSEMVPDVELEAKRVEEEDKMLATVKASMNEQQIGWFFAGSALNLIAAKS